VVGVLKNKMKKSEKIELRNLNNKQLNKKLIELKKEKFKVLGKKHIFSHKKNDLLPIYRKIKKRIAFIYTILKERENQNER